MNDWTRLLLAFLHGKFPEYDYGLTLRFIVGACQNPIGSKFKTLDDAKVAAERIYDEMAQYNKNGHVVTSVFCEEKHNGRVLRLENLSWSEHRIGVDFNTLWQRYGDEIIAGNYHINDDEHRILKGIFPEASG
jgi:hypothetical protein